MKKKLQKTLQAYEKKFEKERLAKISKEEKNSGKGKKIVAPKVSNYLLTNKSIL